MELGEKIAAYRQMQNMTQEELAEKLSVTPQAISKWERNTSMPDLDTFARLCVALSVDANEMLKMTWQNREVWHNRLRSEIRMAEQPVGVCFGMELTTEVFLKQPYMDYVEGQRLQLAKEGFWLPLVRLYDQEALEPREFMILSYHRVLYREVLETVDEHTGQYIMEKMACVVRDHYAYILNRDIVKCIVDNLAVDYPALVEHVVPELISYGLLQKVMVGLLKRGDGLCYMIKTIETMEEELRKNPDAGADELIAKVAAEIEREDNYWVIMHKRKSEPGSLEG